MPRTSIDATLIVFARAPQPGTVKTRLAPLLGAEGAAALHARLVAHTLAVAREAGFSRLELCCTPDVDDAFLQQCASAFDAALATQTGDDLGARMCAAFGLALARATHAVLIGTDCPALTAGHLREAQAALTAGHDAVFAPAEDGGYALVGLTRCDPRLFEGIAWGGPEVMAATRVRLAGLGWRWHELETLWDVDRPADYRRLIESRLLDHRDAHA